MSCLDSEIRKDKSYSAILLFISLLIINERYANHLVIINVKLWISVILSEFAQFISAKLQENNIINGLE